jgi:alpha-ketoglutarate-dependent taurine dioxygenase
MTKVATKLITSSPLPLVIEPIDRNLQPEEFFDFLRQQRAMIQEKLHTHGGVLFRNFPVHGADGFGKAIAALGLGKYLDYIGGDSPRNKIQDGIYTSTEAPPSIKIPLHNELSFVKKYPKHIYFYCETPPKADGETILGDARAIYHAMNPEIRQRFDQKGLRYVSCYFYKSTVMDALNSIQRSHKSWLDVFETDDKCKVEQLCRENDFAYRWNKNDWIQISQQRPATIVHPVTKDKVWFNQAHLYDFSPKLLGWWRYLAVKAFYFQKHMRLHEVYFADDQPIPRSEMYQVLDTLDANTVKFPWQKGDMLVLDNVLAMHGRATFEGKRRVLAAMTG